MVDRGILGGDEAVGATVHVIASALERGYGSIVVIREGVILALAAVHEVTASASTVTVATHGGIVASAAHGGIVTATATAH